MKNERIQELEEALLKVKNKVELIVNYILQEIENNKLSDSCLDVIRKDIKSAKDYGMECDKKQWLKLLNRIEEVI